MSVPPPKIPFNLCLPDGEFLELQALARQEGKTFSQLCHELLGIGLKAQVEPQ